MGKKIKILVAYHKNFFLFKNEIIEPIHVGKCLSEENIPIIGDDTGDNISHLNPFYCETTAIYWAWQNLIGYDYIGLFHYRRYLLKKRSNANILLKLKFECNRIIGFLNKKYKKGEYSNQIKINSRDNFINEMEKSVKYLKEIINKKKYELLIPSKFIHANKTNEEYFNIIGIEHIKVLRELIKTKYSNFSIIFEKTMNNKYLYPANMFVMDKKYYNDYCELLFSILEDHRKRYFDSNKFDGKNSYNRISGYLSELITNAYINNLIQIGVKYKELSIAFLDFN